MGGRSSAETRYRLRSFCMSCVAALAGCSGGGGAAAAPPTIGSVTATPTSAPTAAAAGSSRITAADTSVQPLAAFGPVTTSSITATCGNLGGFAPFSPKQLASRYGSEANYLAAYDSAVQRSIAGGFVLAEDEPGMVARARELYEAFGGP